jgi:hypothetical protein
MKKILLTCFISVIVLMCSCKKILDTTPQDFVTATTFFRNASDATEALNAAYFGLHAQYVYGGYWQARTLAGDDVFCILTGANLYPANLKFDATEPNQIPGLWNGLFSMIEQANIVLKYLPQASMDQTTRNTIQGEALFLRGFCYFQLVDEFGAVPLRTAPTAGPGDVNIARTPVADVYKQILSDMTAAEGLVPTAATANYGDAGYPSKTTIEGILARVCLTMAGYPLQDATKYADAKMWCQKVIASGLHSLNPDYTAVFNNFATKTYDKKEVLWEIDMSDIVGLNEYGYLGYLDGVSSTSTTYGSASAQVHITRHLYNLYGTQTVCPDVRRDYTCANFSYKTPATPSLSSVTLYTAAQIYDRPENKYKIYLTPAPHTGGRSPINFPMLRYSDILLMLAEADNYVNGGPTALAYQCVNQVRERAYAVGLPGSTTTAAQADVAQTYNQNTFQQLIIDERCREFVEEGLRTHDLIRWGIYVSSLKAVGTDASDPNQPGVNTTYKNEVISIATLVQNRNTLLPIPANEVTYNKLMTQNPGW